MLLSEFRKKKKKAIFLFALLHPHEFLLSSRNSKQIYIPSVHILVGNSSC